MSSENIIPADVVLTMSKLALITVPLLFMFLLYFIRQKFSKIDDMLDGWSVMKLNVQTLVAEVKFQREHVETAIILKRDQKAIWAKIDESKNKIEALSLDNARLNERLNFALKKD